MAFDDYIVWLHCKAITMNANDLEGKYANSIEFEAITGQHTWAGDYCLTHGFNYWIEEDAYGPRKCYSSVSFCLKRLDPWEGLWLGGFNCPELASNRTVRRLIADKTSKTVLPTPGHKFRLICSPIIGKPGMGSRVVTIMEVPSEGAIDRVIRADNGDVVDLSEGRFEKFIKEFKGGKYA